MLRGPALASLKMSRIMDSKDNDKKKNVFHLEGLSSTGTFLRADHEKVKVPLKS